MKFNYKLILIIVGVVIVVLQLIPIERNNPPIQTQINWDSEFTKATFYKACADCHSNETKWPWYSYIAPISYLISYDVTTGRYHFNISEINDDERDEAAREVRKGAMPMAVYLPLHSEANLNEADKLKFIEGLIKTFGDEDPKDKKYENKYK